MFATGSVLRQIVVCVNPMKPCDWLPGHYGSIPHGTGIYKCQSWSCVFTILTLRASELAALENLLTMSAPFLLHCARRYDYDPEQYAGSSSLPILVIGSKMDQVQTVKDSTRSRSSPIAEECGADEINLVRV